MHLIEFLFNVVTVIIHGVIDVAEMLLMGFLSLIFDFWNSTFGKIIGTEYLQGWGVALGAVIAMACLSLCVHQREEREEHRSRHPEFTFRSLGGKI